MALKIEIDEKQSSNIQSRSGTKNGRDWSMKSQLVWMYQKGSKFPFEIQLTLPEGHNGYPSGIYSLDIESTIIAGSFKNPQIDNRQLQLIPLPQK